MIIVKIFFKDGTFKISRGIQYVSFNLLEQIPFMFALGNVERIEITQEEDKK